MPTREARGRSPRQLPPHPQGLSALGARSDEPPISWLMDKALAHPQIISLAAGFTDSPSLPVAETRAVLEELLTESGSVCRLDGDDVIVGHCYIDRRLRPLDL